MRKKVFLFTRGRRRENERENSSVSRASSAKPAPFSISTSAEPPRGREVALLLPRAVPPAQSSRMGSINSSSSSSSSSSSFLLLPPPPLSSSPTPKQEGDPRPLRRGPHAGPHATDQGTDGSSHQLPQQPGGGGSQLLRGGCDQWRRDVGELQREREREPPSRKRGPLPCPREGGRRRYARGG